MTVAQDGDRAVESDVWFRYITNTDHLANNRVAPVHLKTNLRRPAAGRTWALELSGRLASLVSQHWHDFGFRWVCEQRIKFQKEGKPVPRKIQLVGRARANVSALRAYSATGAQTDVIYTPISSDNCHADVVVHATAMTDEEVDQIVDWLHDTLIVERVDPPSSSSAAASSSGATSIFPP